VLAGFRLNGYAIEASARVDQATLPDQSGGVGVAMLGNRPESPN